MAGSAREALLEGLRRQVAALEGGGRRGAALPFALPEIDAALPGGGLARGALHEFGGAGGDEEDGALAAGFIAGILARLDAPRPVLWCLAQRDLHPLGAALHGLAPARLILAFCRSDAEILWAMEEGLRCPALAAVTGELATLPLPASRRLQLAAETSGVMAFALRRWRNAESAAKERLAPNVAVTRWRIAAQPESAQDLPGLGRPLWRVELLRCRGGVPKAWIMEAPDATGHVALPAALADRAAEARRRAG